jgi:GntR family transcriptional regulator
LLKNLKYSSPLYVEIADLLRQRIARGLWSRDQKTPTIEELMAEFGVARVTVRQAMDILESEELIERHRGRGTFVVGAPRNTHLFRLESTLEGLSTTIEGTEPKLLTISDTICPAPLRASDGTPARGYRYMKRLHSHGDVPYAVIGIYVASDVFRRAPRRFRSETVIPLLRSLPEVTIARAWQTLTIGSADMETAELLRIAVNSPIAEVRRVFCDENQRVIYLGEVTYRGDFIHMKIDLLS